VLIDEVRDYFREHEKDAVRSVFTVEGFNFTGRGQNAGLAFLGLKPWGERGSKNTAQAVAMRGVQHFAGNPNGIVFSVLPPPVLELGNAGGFDFQLQDQGGVGHDALLAARNQILGLARANPNLTLVRPNGQEDAPQFLVKIDRERASALGLSIADINTTLTAAWGSSYINDFIDRGRVKRVYIQGEPASRMTPDDLNKWYVRNASGEMVQFAAFATGEWSYGPQKLERFNGVPSFNIVGDPVRGYSSGQAIASMEEYAKQLPPGVGYSWNGMSYEQKESGSQAPMLYAVSLIVVFLCLAALYESWSIPVSVMMVVPLGVLGAVAASLFSGMSNDVYFQVGLLTTVGLASKNAILIVEFAKEHFDRGASLVEAALHAAEQRLRPILMTSLAFILGVLPLALASGAGSGSQNALATSVIGGMIAGTVLAVFLVPVFFVVVLSLFKVQPKHGAGDDGEGAATPAAAPAGGH
jgi:multidrug efflux pump